MKEEEEKEKEKKQKERKTKQREEDTYILQRLALCLGPPPTQPSCL